MTENLRCKMCLSLSYCSQISCINWSQLRFKDTTDAPTTNGEADTTTEEKTDESLKRKDAPTEVGINTRNRSGFPQYIQQKQDSHLMRFFGSPPLSPKKRNILITRSLRNILKLSESPNYANYTITLLHL